MIVPCLVYLIKVFQICTPQILKQWIAFKCIQWDFSFLAIKFKYSRQKDKRKKNLSLMGWFVKPPVKQGTSLYLKKTGKEEDLQPVDGQLGPCRTATPTPYYNLPSSYPVKFWLIREQDNKEGLEPRPLQYTIHQGHTVILSWEIWSLPSWISKFWKNQDGDTCLSWEEEACGGSEPGRFGNHGCMVFFPHPSQWMQHLFSETILSYTVH